LPGNVQWMTADVASFNTNAADAVTVHSLQLWVNLPAADKMVDTNSKPGRCRSAARGAAGRGNPRFLRKVGDVIAPTKNYSPVTMLEVRLEAGARIRQELPADYNAFLVVLEGDA